METFEERDIRESVEELDFLIGLLGSLRDIERYPGLPSNVYEKAISGIYRTVTEISIVSRRLEEVYGNRFYREGRDGTETLEGK